MSIQKISIITPVYNPATHILGDTIQSVITQTYPKWELCIADGNSGNSNAALAIAAEQVYRHQLQIEAPPCLKQLDELSEDQFYWMWKYFEAISKDNLDQADDNYDKLKIAREEGDRELDRVSREQGW